MMMNKITRQAVTAFVNKEDFKKANDKVRVNKDGSVAYTLHGNLIAMLNRHGKILIKNCGWSTKTTKRRLNGILAMVGSGSIVKRQGEWKLRKYNETLEDYELIDWEWYHNWYEVEF